MVTMLNLPQSTSLYRSHGSNCTVPRQPSYCGHGTIRNTKHAKETMAVISTMQCCNSLVNARGSIRGGPRGFAVQGTTRRAEVRTCVEVIGQSMPTSEQRLAATGTRTESLEYEGASASASVVEVPRGSPPLTKRQAPCHLGPNVLT